MIRATTALAAILIMASGTASAAPWRIDSYTINPGTFHSAVQLSSDEDYALVVQCHEETGAFEVYVESPIDWEPGASYAPEVPATVVVDNHAITDVMFHFDDRQMGEGIVAFPNGQADAFARMLDLFAEASIEVGIAYFDKQATFSVEGLGAAMRSLRESCL